MLLNLALSLAAVAIAALFLLGPVFVFAVWRSAGHHHLIPPTPRSYRAAA